MTKELPAIIVFSYTVFSLFQFYQALHVKNFRGSAQGALIALNVSALAGMIFSYAYLIYYGYAVGWYWPIVLFVVALVVKSAWFFVEAKLRVKDLATWMSLSGFAVLPITGYLLLSSVPQ